MRARHLSLLARRLWQLQPLPTALFFTSGASFRAWRSRLFSQVGSSIVVVAAPVASTAAGQRIPFARARRFSIGSLQQLPWWGAWALSMQGAPQPPLSTVKGRQLGSTVPQQCGQG